MDGRGGIKGDCARCHLLMDIWEASLQLNALIHKFDPQHDDLRRRRKAKAHEPDPRQLSLI